MKHINLFLTCHKDYTYEVQRNMLLLENLSTYYTWKNIRKQYKNNKLKIIAPAWNDEFELPDGSYSISDIQDIILNISLKNMKQQQQFLLFMFTSIEIIIG